MEISFHDERASSRDTRGATVFVVQRNNKVDRMSSNRRQDGGRHLCTTSTLFDARVLYVRRYGVAVVILNEHADAAFLSRQDVLNFRRNASFLANRERRRVRRLKGDDLDSRTGAVVNRWQLLPNGGRARKEIQ